MSPGLHKMLEELGFDGAQERALDHINDTFDAMFSEIDPEIMRIYREDDLF